MQADVWMVICLIAVYIVDVILASRREKVSLRETGLILVQQGKWELIPYCLKLKQ